MTETGLSLGTPHYMSPEQATAETEITGRSDVYSLASVLYEMLAGVPPHEGGSAQQTIMRILTDTPRPVTEVIFSRAMLSDFEVFSSNLRRRLRAHQRHFR